LLSLQGGILKLPVVEANYTSARRTIVMTRYKGRTSLKTIEWDFPFIIEIAVPPSGLDKTLDVKIG
jgi:hypothetical protein